MEYTQLSMQSTKDQPEICRSLELEKTKTECNFLNTIQNRHPKNKDNKIASKTPFDDINLFRQKQQNNDINIQKLLMESDVLASKFSNLERFLKSSGPLSSTSEKEICLEGYVNWYANQRGLDLCQNFDQISFFRKSLTIRYDSLLSIWRRSLSLDTQKKSKMSSNLIEIYQHVIDQLTQEKQFLSKFQDQSESEQETTKVSLKNKNLLESSIFADIPSTSTIYLIKSCIRHFREEGMSSEFGND